MLVELTGSFVVVADIYSLSTMRSSIASVIPDFSPSSGCVINIFSKLFIFLSFS